MIPVKRSLKFLLKWGGIPYEGLVEVLGASQVAEYAERYPGTATELARDQILEGLTFEEWRVDAQLENDFEGSADQIQMIDKIRAGILGESKHIRILGDPGLGKTRIVLEAVKEKGIAPTVLYIPHGTQFVQTKLFRHLLKGNQTKPLVLIIDELPETEMAEIWRQLKPRCGYLKLVSLDHGKDASFDFEIEWFEAPKLGDETIKKILVARAGDSREIDRWVEICEGSPRVAIAVADNLLANPDDLLRAPSTVPLWERFLHGYGRRDENSARQVDCVTQHLALFSRFGLESPVSEEAEYISQWVQNVDPTIGRARFQEIIRNLRSRRVLQGSKTLFFVPKALHIHLWKQFWVTYGHGFDFARTFNEMPESLHTWFMSMFKYAEGPSTSHVLNDILRVDGIFSDRAVLTSSKGSRFLSILAEANPGAVLRLLEGTVGKWSDQELLDFKHDRQNLVWTLEKIAVWQEFTTRVIPLLARLAINENASNANNSTGTLVDLFRIGPEAAATESSPQVRLPALLKLLRSSLEAERNLGIKAMLAALVSDGTGFRIVGPEFQGLKGRAKLWIPKTYGEWWEAKHVYFQALVNESNTWPLRIRADSSLALLRAVEHQIMVPQSTELGFQVLGSLSKEPDLPPSKLNEFFRHWQEHGDWEQYPEITKRIRNLERRHSMRDLASRFQRFVVDVSWMEWDEDIREQRKMPRSHAKALVRAIAGRIGRSPDNFMQIRHLLAPTTMSAALWEFGRELAISDAQQALLGPLIGASLESKHQVCLHGYLSTIQAQDVRLYHESIANLFEAEGTAWLGATLVLRSEYDENLFDYCLDALDKKWIDPHLFISVRYGKAIASMPVGKVRRLFQQLREHENPDSLLLLNELLTLLPFNESSPFDPDFVFDAVSRSVPDEEHRGGMVGYYWKQVCEKLINWDPSRLLPLLDILLAAMEKEFRLSYDSHVVSVANSIVNSDPAGAWNIIAGHFEKTLPKWRTDILQWLKGGLSGFNDEKPNGAVSVIPIPVIISWIEIDIEHRASLIARAAPRTLDDEGGGGLTRMLLQKYVSAGTSN